METDPKEFVTIRVYKDDRESLNGFGRFTHDALSNLLQTHCVHPEETKIYLTANVLFPASQVEKPVGGFFCSRCGKYVFTEPKKNKKAAR